MWRRVRTVKGMVITLMIVFALVVSALVSAFSFYLMYTFQRRTTVQSTEFNLQLVASVIEQDLLDLTSLGIWCTTNPQITTYLTSSYNVKPLSMRAYNRLFEEYSRNRAAWRYMRRLIVLDKDYQKILQLSNESASQPVTVYSIHKLSEQVPLDTHSEWEMVIEDIFFPSSSRLIPLIAPIKDPNNGLIDIGAVYLGISVETVTDKLKGYAPPEGSELYLTLGGTHYRIEGEQFLPVESIGEITEYHSGDATSTNTTVASIRGEEGHTVTMVSYPVRDGIVLSQVLPNGQFMPQRGAWASLLIGVCLLILLLALFITYQMDSNISRPVAALRQKIDRIAEGDFSPEPSLESDTELGLVGKGINKLSHDVMALMETRIEDQRQQQELEYRMLQSQINPHFLYNTLNSIKWMATIQHADGIAEMTTALSRLLRTISKDIRKTVPLADELALLEDYLVIQRYRYGDNVAVVKEIESEALLSVMIPRFTLQPLVENAIFHGIEPKGAGTIRIRARQCENDVLVSVTDDGIGMNPEKVREIYLSTDEQSGMMKGMGLRNVDERLRHAYGDAYGLSIDSREGSFTTMAIRLPWISETGIEEEAYD